MASLFVKTRRATNVLPTLPRICQDSVHKLASIQNSVVDSCDFVLGGSAVDALLTA